MDLLTFSLGISDHRVDRMKLHQVQTIIYVSLVGVLCGGETWEEIAAFGRSKESFFRSRLPDFNGIPSHDTLNRFFNVLDPVYFEHEFRHWVDCICNKYHGIVAIDGKTIRGASSFCSSGDDSNKRGSSFEKLHIVSAWAAGNGISLGQVKVDNKSNEITAIPELINALDLAECIVTIDVMGCQKNIAQTIIDNQADYILCIKGNQGNLHEYCQKIFSEENRIYLPMYYGNYITEENAHGRMERRECIVYQSEALPYFFEEWKGLRSFVKIISTRKQKGKEETTETRYYMTSLGKDPQLLAQYIRTHWSIENNLHWQLDVSFREDNTRKRKNAAQNVSAIAKMALTLLKKDEKKVGIASKRKIAGWDEQYLEKILKQKIF